MWWFGSFKMSQKDLEGLGRGALIFLLIVVIGLAALCIVPVLCVIGATLGVGFWDFVWGIIIFFAILCTIANI